MALTTEQIQQLMSAGIGGGAMNIGGNIYTPTWVPGGTTEANDGGYTFGGYNMIPQGWKFGDMAQQYDAQGNKTGEWATSAPDLWDKLGPGLAMALIGYAGGQALMGGLGGGNPMSGFDAGVPTAGEVAAQNAAFADTLSPYLSRGVPQMMGQLELIPESAMPVGPAGYTGPTFPGVPPVGGGGGGGGGGSLIPGVSDKALGIGATLLGGALGSQETPGQTQEKKMDPRMDAFVYDSIMPAVKGLLGTQLPIAQQAGDQMRTIGTGLLGQSVAPNGFERFTRGRY